WHQAPKTRSSVVEDFLPRQVRRLFSRLPFEATTSLFSHSKRRHPNFTCSLDIVSTWRLRTCWPRSQPVRILLSAKCTPSRSPGYWVHGVPDSCKSLLI